MQTLLSADRVLDGSGMRYEPGAVVVEGGTVRDVGPLADIVAKAGAGPRRVDYGEATILPGLIDVHTHLSVPSDGTPIEDAATWAQDSLLRLAVSNAERVLRSGVTTVRENGAKGRVAFELRDLAAAQRVPVPRLIVSGRPLTSPTGHMWYFGSAMRSVAELRAEVVNLCREGADFIKVVASGGTTRGTDPHQASISAEALAAITAEAHGQGRRVAVHCTCSEAVDRALSAGADMIVHCVFSDQDGALCYRPDLVDRLAETGTWVNPTLTVAQAWLRVLQRRKSAGTIGEREDAELRALYDRFQLRIEFLARMAETGVNIAAGSDAAWEWHPTGDFADELTALAEAGLGPEKALHAATLGAAYSLGLEKEIGLIAPARHADLLVVASNPLQRIGALRDVVAVYQAGQLISSPVAITASDARSQATSR